MHILLFNLAALAGATAQGLTGFGSGTVTLTLLVLVYPFREVVPVVAAGTVAVNLLMLWLARRELEWRRGPIAAVPLAAGVVIGAQLLAVLPVSVLKHGLGVAILIYVAVSLARTPNPGRLPPFGAMDIAGLATASLSSGVIVGAVGVSPIPLLIYVGVRYPKQHARALLTQAFVLGSVTQMVVYSHLGLIDLRLAVLALAMLPGILMGLAIGHRWHYRVDQKTFARALALILLLPALRLVLS